MPERRPRVAHLTTVDLSLAKLLAAELQVDVACGFETIGISAPGPYVAEVEALGVRHVPIPAFTRAWDPRRDARAARELGLTLRRLRLDVLHTHTPKAGVLGRVLGRLVGVPVVVNTCHGLWAQPDDPPLKRALVYAAEVAAAWCSDAELYQNDTDRRALQRWTPRSRALTVGNGIDLERFGRDEAARRRVRGELGVGEGQLLVGGVGRRVAEKGIHEFATAAGALADRARFVWVGPSDHDKPDAVAEDVPNLTFLGMRGDMPAIYSALDVFVLPSWREGFSRSAMEAAASGCALVLTDVRGCREIGCNEREVLLTPPRDPLALTDALARVIDDADLRRRLARAAEARARLAFDQRRVAAASIAAYAAAAARG